MDAGDPDRGRMFPPHALHQLPMCLLLLQEESKRYIFSKLFPNTFVKYCFAFILGRD